MQREHGLAVSIGGFQVGVSLLILELDRQVPGSAVWRTGTYWDGTEDRSPLVLVWSLLLRF